MEKLETRLVPFMGSDLMAARDGDGQVWAGAKWMCNGIGLSKNQTDNQIQKLQTEKALKRGCGKFPAGVFDPNNETIAVKLDYVPLWLAKINITPSMEQETPELAERLLEYQIKAKDVLAAAFLGAAEDVQRNEYLHIAKMLSKTSEAQLPYVLEALKRGGIDLGTTTQSDQRPAVNLGIAAQPYRKPSNAPADPWHIREFLADILPRAMWNLLPYGLLRTMYISWMRRNYPGVASLGGNRNKFIDGLRIHADLVYEHAWTFTGLVRIKDLMDGPEPLIAEFGIARPRLSDRCRGICKMA